MSTGDLLATLLNQLGLNNSFAANASKNKEVKPSQFPAPITNPNLVAYQAFGPIGPSYFAPPAPMYGPAPTYIQAQAGLPSGQATILPHAFTVGSLHDLITGAWNMDTGGDVLRRLVSNNVISCNNEKPPVLCHACQLGKHVRLSFVSSNTVVTSCFDIVHSDVWTSPIPSLSGFKYYVLFLDHYSQFVWVYPLLNKSDVWSKFVLLRTYVRTQFKCEIRSFQCDHGGEFDNRNLHKLFAENGIQFRFSCPKTSQQNGKSERMVRTINNLIRTLLFQANLPPTFWVEALNMATRLLNILPSTAITNEIPYTRLFGKQLDYSLLGTFGCLCYPHLYPNHKLEPRATPSILLGHASNHSGYRCLDLHTNKIPTYTFLDDSPDIPTQPIRSIPVLDPDTIHATHTPPPNTTPTNINIAPSAQPELPPHVTPSHNSPTQQSTTAHDTPPHI
ncbi:ribonuclease H-like domain-containing protein [Tanacetum coccineum]